MFIKLLSIVLLLISLLITGCRNHDFSASLAPQTGYSTQSTPQEVIEPVITTHEFDATTENELYPENGQEGGIGTAGENNGFRAYLCSEREGKWGTRVWLQNFDTNTGIEDAIVTINFRYSQSVYYSIKLPQDPSRKGSYWYYYFSVPFAVGKRAGFYHVISQSRNIDFKIGFGIEITTVDALIINGWTKTGDSLAVPVFLGIPLTISVVGTNLKYFDIQLAGPCSNTQIFNYYSPDSKITLSKEIMSNAAIGWFGHLWVISHPVYIAKGFRTQVNADGTKQLQMVSVRYGENILKGCILKYY